MKVSKSIPNLVVNTAESDNRMQLFEGSNAYNPEASGVMPKLAKGENPWTTIAPSPFTKSSCKTEAKAEAEAEVDEHEDKMHKKEVKKSDLDGVTTDGSDPKLKKHKKQFEAIRSLHENMDAMQKKSMRGERIAAKLKKCIIDDVRDLIKSYGEENLINTHGEQFMSDADKQVLDWIRSIERIDIDLSPTHNPPVPRSYASHKSMSEETYIAVKAFD